MFIGDDTDDLIYDPNEAPILHQTFPSVRPPAREKRNAFLENNSIEIIDGKFSEKEDKRILRNYNKFLQFYKIQDSTATRCGLLGFKSENPDHDATIDLVKQLIKPCGFHFRLAEKMPNRLISAVYGRARKLLTPFRKQKEIGPETQREIIEYAKSIGEKKHIYAHIANKFNCDPAAARRIVKRMVDTSKEMDFKKGKWSRRETIRLLDSICDHLHIEPKDITTKIILATEISWPEVSKGVRTRSFERCREHAINILTRNLPAMIIAVNKRRAKKEKS